MMKEQKRIVILGALILAAGNGTRIGTPKLRLSIKGKTYFEHILDILQREEVKPIVCVVGPLCEEWVHKIAPECTIIVNRHPEDGMISSVRLGIPAVQSSTGVFIVPVDHPFVAAETYRSMKQEFLRQPDVILNPSYRKRSGHPVVLPKKLYDTIVSDRQNYPLRRVLQESGIPRIFVDVDDPGVVKNINEETDVPGKIKRRKGE